MKHDGFHGQMSDKFRSAVFIILSGGFQDAYTYCCRGGVFANAQTGNIVLMSSALFRGDWGAVVKYLVPVLSFLLGIAVAELVHVHYRRQEKIHWRQIVLIEEIILLFIVGFIPISRPPGERAGILRLRAAGADVPQDTRAALRQHDVHRQHAQRHGITVRLVPQPRPRNPGNGADLLRCHRRIRGGRRSGQRALDNDRAGNDMGLLRTAFGKLLPDVHSRAAGT